MAHAPAGHGTPALNLDAPIRAGYAIEYPHQVWYFVGSFIFLVSVCQLLSYILHGRTVSSGVGRRLINIYRVLAFRYTLSIGSYSLNIAEVFCTVAYITALWTWELVNTTDLQDQKFTPSYMSSRSGTIATSQFPLIVALGMKNNILSLLTGVSYDKLNYIHRMTARVCFVLLLLHTGLKFHRADHRWHETFIRMGMLGIMAFCVLIVMSLRPVRANAYEVFFYAHFVLVLLFLIGAYYHTRPYHYDPYTLTALGLWAFDRLARICRILFYHRAEATVERLSPDFVRLRVSRPKRFHWAPGQTAYLIMPGVSRIPWEAHPFTIASCKSAVEESAYEDSLEKVDSIAVKGVALGGKNDLVFLINVRGGFTRRLGEIAESGRKLRVFVDGPYGPLPRLDGFDTGVFVAGGSGVSFTLPLMLDAVKRGLKKVVFIWVVRDSSHLEWISDAIKHIPEAAVDMRVYVTNRSEITLIDSEEKEREGPWDEEMTSPSTIAPPPQFLVRQGRPDLNVVLKEAVHDGGAVGVFVCGSKSIAQAARKALRNPGDGESVVLHLESFGYA